MCYELNDYTRSIYPMKLNEYLATGLPIVSSPIETVLGYATVVSIAKDEAEWLDAIDRGLTEPMRSETAVAQRRAVARGNDWDVLVSRIAELFRSGMERKREHRKA